MTLPTLIIPHGRERRVMAGHPWLYSNELQLDNTAKALPPGTLVKLRTERGSMLGLATFNPHTLIAARVLERNVEATIDANWFVARFKAALTLRDKLFTAPYYRLVHAEGDNLPGFVVDRYGDTAVLQANTAGMNMLLPHITTALSQLGLASIIHSRSGVAVKLEGLEDVSALISGTPTLPLEIIENETRYLVDPLHGQKTGWFYDQRDNRAFVASLAKGETMLDAYCYAGGFGVLAKKLGASEVTLVDSAEGALELAKQALTANNLTATLVKADVMDFLAADSKTYGVVALDPPAFIKTKKDYAAGMKGYAKLVRLGAARVRAGGFFVLTSCSHHADVPGLQASVAEGLHRAGRTGRLIRLATAAPDHPVHPLLPESSYLKCLAYHLD
jgi:23S rRNA (cytosine1962-C5)-methyltransferase